jgi:very-short-patch-repair endonuclease
MNLFKPHPKKHLNLNNDFKVMDIQTIAKRRRELTRKNFPSEAWFIKLMNEHLISGYRRNMPILSRFFGDFVWRKHKIVIEIDGKSHCGKEAYDKTRDDLIRSFGITVIRIKFNDTSAAMEAVEFLKSKGLRKRTVFVANNH